MAEKRKRRILLEGIDWVDNGIDVCYTWDDLALRDYSGDAVITLETGYIKDYAFQGSAIESFQAPDFAGTGSQMTRSFEGCTALTSVDMPLFAGTFGGYVFSGCTGLESVHIPKAKGANSYMFQNCTSLPALAMPAITSNAQTSMFQGCSALEAVDLGSPGRIDGNCFKNTALEVLVLRKSSVVALQNVNAFDGSPFASGGSGGTLYVPNDLIASYQAASNWSTILGYANNSIEAIEGSIYEEQYADGTPVE